MLNHLYINNYTLIQELDLKVNSDLTVITGETGAGKSIILGALSLILGQRADSGSLQDTSKKCIIEGTFEINKYGLSDFFKDNEIDYSEDCIIRREILPSGSSRAFVNDTPVNLNLLKELSEKLIDIHSQHQTLSLNSSDFQISIIDSFAGNHELVSAYKASYFNYKNIQKELSELLEKDKQLKKEKDYILFQLNELEEAKLDTVNQQELENELEVLNNAEEIKTALSQSLKLFNEGEFNLLNLIHQIKNLLQPYSTINLEIKELFNRISSNLIELKDLCNEVDLLEEKTNYDPEKLSVISSKLDLLYKLFKKHSLHEVNELINLREELSAKLFQINNIDDIIVKTQIEKDTIRNKLQTAAELLSKRRINAFEKLEHEWLKLIKQLGMENARIKIEHKICDEYERNGIDKIIFHFNANKGGELKEMSKSASGGELSRLMLSIKHIIAKNTLLPCIIFDEIDTGISGEIADKMGSIMKQMAKHMQVIAITHLPQIASKGNEHWLVYKDHNSEQTKSNIRKLNSKERILELAKMLSNSNPTQAALKNAEEMLGIKH